MRNRKVIILLLILIAVAAYFFFNQGSGTLREEYKDFAVKDTSDISRIFITTQKNERADLKKVEQGEWTINDNYKARQDAIDLLLETFYRIDVEAPVPQSAFENVVKQLATMGTKVEIYMNNGSKAEKTYYVGQATENHRGTYMLLEVKGKKSSIPFITFVPGFYGYLSTRFFTDELLWRDRTIFAHTAPEIKSLKMEYPGEPEKSFTVVQNKGEFQVKRGNGQEIQGIDRVAMEEYLDRYESVHFEYIDTNTPEEQKDSILNSRPLHIIELTDLDGITRQLKTFYMPVPPETYDINTGETLTHDLDRLLGWIDGKDFVAIQWLILDELLISAGDIENATAVNK